MKPIFLRPLVCMASLKPCWHCWWCYYEYDYRRLHVSFKWLGHMHPWSKTVKTYTVADLIVRLLTLIRWQTERAHTATGRWRVHPEGITDTDQFKTTQNNMNNKWWAQSSENMLRYETTPVEIQQLIGNLGPYASSINHRPRCGGDAWYNRKGLLAIFWQK